VGIKANEIVLCVSLQLIITLHQRDSFIKGLVHSFLSFFHFFKLMFFFSSKKLDFFSSLHCFECVLHLEKEQRRGGGFHTVDKHTLDTSQSSLCGFTFAGPEFRISFLISDFFLS